MRTKDFRFHVGLNQRLWVSFKRLETDIDLENSVNYYRVLSNWVMDNKDRIGDSILDEFRLNILIELDPDKYVTINSELSPEMERKRMFGGEKPKHLERLTKSIGDTLWILATVHSGVDCPDCIYDDGLRYVLIENLDIKEKKLALSCESCGHLQSLDGRTISKEGLSIMPASKEDIEEYSV